MATLSVPNPTFTSGTTIVASEMNANFAAVVDFVNTTPALLQLTGGQTITGAIQLNSTLTVGSTGAGHDVKLWGNTAGDYFEWDADTNKLIIEGTNGTTALNVSDGNVVVEDTVTAATFVGALTGDVTGNADTATEATNVTVSANNTTDETVYPTFVDGATSTQGIETDTGLTYNPSTGLLTATAFAGNITGDVTGNADTATELATARAINGVDFDGSGAITVTAAAGTLTGSTLNSGVTASSLTSVGTLTSATITGDLTVDTSTLKVDATNNRVGVNTAVPSYNLDVYGNGGTGYVARIMAAAGTENMLIIRAGAASPSTNFAQFLDSGDVEHGEIVGYGVGVQFNSASDRRLKHSITDLNMGLETVRALQPRSFLMLGSENLGTQAGFIADEVETVVPTVVSGEKDAVEVVPATDNESEYERVRPQKLNMTGLVPHVVAAIKELDSRLAAIEAA